ncbi:TonB-dependent receptor [Parvularcula oceani]|uniref:TonB-dependent receptor n=1 Tax=Parvularcula oceani TaxID=1247963 RepID=UPI00068E179A|nr:TonB-dependent receptor [Parvularcula oceani]
MSNPQVKSVLERPVWALLLGTASAASMAVAMPAMAQTGSTVDQEEFLGESDTRAQDDIAGDEQNADVIVVEGIRRSLSSAQDIKREANTFVDAITAEDIGALPDRSVTEALQRVPGVQISRFAAANDPDHFSIEGQDVLVRGLTFVRSELNGRDTFSANNGRALSFADVPPELLGGVSVYKNQTADLIEGGIAGTVNLITRKPFDKAGQVIAGAVEMNYGDFREEVTPTVSGLYSNDWYTDAGRFGVLINGVYSDLKTRSDGTQVSSFQPRTDLAGDGSRTFVPEGAALRTQDYDRERKGFGGSLQWENPSETVLATAEFLRSEATTSWNEHVIEIATDNVGDTAFFPVPGTEFGFTDDSLFSYGQISAPTGWRADQNTDPTTPIYGLQSNNINRGVEQEYLTQDASFNVKFTPNDRWAFNLDYQFIDSEVSNTDIGIWGSSFQDVLLDTRQNIPEVILTPPTQVEGQQFQPNSGIAYDCANGISNTCPDYADTTEELYDPQYSFWRAAMDHLEDSEGQEHAFRADVDYDFMDEMGPLRAVRVGGRWSERDQTTRFSTYNWGALSEIWGNGGPVWMDEFGVPEGVVENFGWNNFQRGEVVRPPAYPYFMDAGEDYDATADFADAVVTRWLDAGGVTGGATGGSGGWRRLAEREGVVEGTPFLPGEITDVTEETIAAYIRLDYGFDNLGDSGMSLDGNFGVRWFQTDLTSSGAFQFPDPSTLPITSGLAPNTDPDGPIPIGGENVCLAPYQDTSGGDTPVSDGQPGTIQDTYTIPEFCDLTDAEEAAIRAFANNASEVRDVDNKYDLFLPSFNAKLQLNEDMLIRFAYSRSISRPEVGLLRPSYTITPSLTDDPRTLESENPRGSSGFYGFQGTGGNPILEPVKSDNFDLSYEWYFAEVGSLTVSAFYKEIQNIIVTGQSSATFENNGQTFDVFLTNVPTNSDDTGKVKGFELAYQQFYDMLPAPFDGLGTQATYTYIDSTGVQSSGLDPTLSSPGQSEALIDLSDFPLQGLSKHNFNIAAIYEKDKISTRLVYNWRDDYLVTPRDAITPFYPIFQEATGQLDGSFFYTVNENVKVGVQGANLLNDITETTTFIPNSDGLRGARSFFQNDRRITLSARFSF